MIPNAASFLITEDCNFSCTYCFETHNKAKMTPEIIKAGLDYLVTNAIKENKKEFHAMIFGGEPLLYPELVELVFSYGCELADKFGKTFTTSIVTNGSIFNDEIARIVGVWKNKANLHVQLSIDGIKEVQDAYRVSKGGKGTFDSVEKNIPKWKEVFDGDMKRLSIHGCYNHKTLPHMFESYKFFREVWNVPKIWFMPIHSEIWSDDDSAIYKSELTKIKDYVLDKIKADGIVDEIYNYAPLDRCLRPDQFPGSLCGAGKTFVTICANGDIYPCHHFYFNDPDKTLLLGNILADVKIDDFKRKMFIEYNNKDISCTKDNPNCDSYQCYRCIADNWVKNGSILSQITGPRCEMSKIERQLQIELKEEVKKMGLLKEMKQPTDSEACRCNLGQPQSSVCGCNLGGPPSLDKEDGDQLAFILKVVLDKLQNIEDAQHKLEVSMEEFLKRGG